ncbi:MAG: c-type cytochrome [Opitutales bacterium]|jgi:mono/diheme cytochrome c family protein|nr:c-type cytochrome [Opitutales bacterium]
MNLRIKSIVAIAIGWGFVCQAALNSTELVKAGETAYNLYCVACHQQDAAGKVGFAPNIRNKDFLALVSDDFLRQSIVNGRPGTAMVAWSFLQKEQIDGLIAYLRAEDLELPVEPIVVDPDKTYPGSAIEGEGLFVTYCAPCHGEKGMGYATGGPGPFIGGEGFLSVASDDFIYKTLEHGRVGTAMRAFLGPKAVANLSPHEAGSIIAYLRSLNGAVQQVELVVAESSGDSAKGEAAFNINCAACHQSGGTGKAGFAPSIRNQDFLAIASDSFIKDTISKGRPGTSMIGRPDISDTVLNDIIAYLRSIPMGAVQDVKVDPTLVFHGDADKGEQTYSNFCSACHGPKGEGYMAGVAGPAIGLSGFLEIASDDYIMQTVKRGRVATAMKSFIGAEGVANLSEEDIHDVISHLRSQAN